jgi:uncharacterized protein with HEPN domain
MPPTLADRLVHILEAINTIQKLLAERTFEDFANDLLARLAVERSFEIISEASRRIPDDIKAQQRTINWRGLADLGNLLPARLSPHRHTGVMGSRHARFATAKDLRRAGHARFG